MFLFPPDCGINKMVRQTAVNKGSIQMSNCYVGAVFKYRSPDCRPHYRKKLGFSFTTILSSTTLCVALLVIPFTVIKINIYAYFKKLNLYITVSDTSIAVIFNTQWWYKHIYTDICHEKQYCFSISIHEYSKMTLVI